MKLKILHTLKGRPDDRGMCYTDYRAFIKDQLQSFFVNFGPLGLVNSLFPLQHQLVVFLALPLSPDGRGCQTVEKHGQEVVRVAVVSGQPS